VSIDQRSYSGTFNNASPQDIFGRNITGGMCSTTYGGHSDMALGLARFVGVRLPANFDSPLKASSNIDL